MNYCEHGKINATNIFCNILKENCCLVRWCSNSQCIKNTDNFKDCLVRSDKMEKNKKEIEDSKENLKINKEVENKQEKDYKEKLCKVLWVRNNSFAIDFEGYGIQLNKKENKEINDFVKIKYLGQIGKDDFIYEIV